MAETIQDLIDEELTRSGLGTDPDAKRVPAAVVKALNSSMEYRALVSLPGEGDLDGSDLVRRVDSQNVRDVRVLVRQVVDNCVRLRQGV